MWRRPSIRPRWPRRTACCARSGRLYVAEPLAEGDLYALTRMVENEDDERAAAQATIAAAARAGFALQASRRYDVVSVFADVEAFRRMTVSVDPARAAVYARRAPGDRATLH